MSGVQLIVLSWFFFVTASATRNEPSAKGFSKSLYSGLR